MDFRITIFFSQFRVLKLKICMKIELSWIMWYVDVNAVFPTLYFTHNAMYAIHAAIINNKKKSVSLLYENIRIGIIIAMLNHRHPFYCMNLSHTLTHTYPMNRKSHLLAKTKGKSALQHIKYSNKNFQNRMERTNNNKSEKKNHKRRNMNRQKDMDERYKVGKRHKRKTERERQREKQASKMICAYCN